MKETIKKIFPWVVPLRKKQRIHKFYKNMEHDQNIYSKKISKNQLPYIQFQDRFVMINKDTGFDLVYQENKIFNLKLAANAINGVIIKPGEVFSFWQLARFADKDISYKDGLVVVDGELTTANAGGLCHISNLLCWVFLHSPLTIIERTGHKSREFPYSPDMLIGVDATIMEGLVDLKVKNETKQNYQIQIDFDEKYMYGKIFTDNPNYHIYEIQNKNLKYFEINGETYEEVDIYRNIYNQNNELLDSVFLYKSKCHIGYEMTSQKVLKEEAI